MLISVATRRYSDYIQYPDRAETAAQDATPTESYGNFGLRVKRALTAAAVNGSNRIALRRPRSSDISTLTCLDDLY